MKLNQVSFIPREVVHKQKIKKQRIYIIALSLAIMLTTTVMFISMYKYKKQRELDLYATQQKLEIVKQKLESDKTKEKYYNTNTNVVEKYKKMADYDIDITPLLLEIWEITPKEIEITEIKTQYKKVISGEEPITETTNGMELEEDIPISSVSKKENEVFSDIPNTLIISGEAKDTGAVGAFINGLSNLDNKVKDIKLANITKIATGVEFTINMSVAGW